ncbi:hypothetical protein [Burkholderia sp. RS02]|uniref:hypothetical protein n=1 Tax=unclassified Burkholderia TaxID=2613784 RepID=UPI0032183ECD
MAENVPFYSDVRFWQFLIAAVALTLSQLPPVRLWFKRARLSVDVFDRAALDEELGLPHAQIHITISNSGGREIKINKITATITRGNESRVLIARGYFEKFSDQRPTLLTPFRVKPGQEWGHNVNFPLPVAWNDRNQVSAMSKALRDNIKAKRTALGEPKEDVPADQNLVDPLAHRFDTHFFWKAGEYTVNLKIETEDGRADVNSVYRFIIFESESDLLRSHKDQIKFGNGVHYRLPPIEPLIIELHRENEGRR